MNSAGVYLHVPFCEGKCPYCDFYSLAADEAGLDAYLEGMLRAVEAAPEPGPADTLYFGGGTPPLLGEARLLRLLEACVKRFSLPDTAEITLEANPRSVTPQMLKALRAGGFNRISFGVQSTNGALLRTLGRRHTAGEARRAVFAACGAGFARVSADLMLAVPGQTVEGVFRDVKTLAAWPIDHLSAYLLKLEPNTAFFRRYPPPDDDFSADCYLALIDAARSAGFSQYEISNFAKTPGAQSRHNLKYWRGAPYLGIGPAAHSFLNARRFFFPPDTAAFAAAENPWTLTVDDGAGGGEEERLLLGLRLCEGIAPDDFPGLRGRIERRLPALVKAGLASFEAGRLSLTPRGFLVSNSIIASLLS